MNPTDRPHPTLPAAAGLLSPPSDSLGKSAESLTSCASAAQQIPPDDSAEFQRLYDDLRRLYPLRSEVGRRLLRQVTRHLLFIDLGSRAELEALKEGAAAARLLQMGAAPSPEAGILCAINNPATARVCEYQALHLRQFRLLESQLENHLRLENSRFQNFDIRRFFPDEQACLQHLRTRLEHSDWRCPRCESPRGDWLNSTGRWECRGCHFQAGVRHGTVMFRSKIPLTKWFPLIDLISNEHPMTGSELGRHVGIARESTVRDLETTVRSALQLPDSDRLLAGIPTFRQTCNLSQMSPSVGNDQRDRLRSPCSHLTQNP